ncbi:MAG: hypothetical protein EA411_11870 [Saprospirales bacterium]|nr:MAG: hypothetical protein EA411_11870 [Saprospirales bacterium]
MDTPGELVITVFNVTGKAVIHEKLTGEGTNYIQQDVSFLEAGSYHIWISAEDGLRSSHFVISR